MKNLDRSGAHCATRDIFACGEEVWQGWVPLYHLGGTREEAGATGKNLCIREELGQKWVTLCH